MADDVNHDAMFVSLPNTQLRWLSEVRESLGAWGDDDCQPDVVIDRTGGGQ